MWAGSPCESLPDFFRQSVVLTNRVRSLQFGYSARAVVADTIGITMTGGRSAGLCVLLQDKGQGKTTDRLALTFFILSFPRRQISRRAGGVSLAQKTPHKPLAHNRHSDGALATEESGLPLSAALSRMRQEHLPQRTQRAQRKSC